MPCSCLNAWKHACSYTRDWISLAVYNHCCFYYMQKDLHHNFTIFSSAWSVKYKLLIQYIVRFHRKFKLGRNMRLSWSGLWLLIVLLSTSVLNTSLSILNCPSLSDDSGNKKLVCVCYTVIVLHVYLLCISMHWFLFLRYSPLYTSSKERVAPVISIKVTYFVSEDPSQSYGHYASFWDMLTLLYNIANEEQYKKHLWNQPNC